MTATLNPYYVNVANIIHVATRPLSVTALCRKQRAVKQRIPVAMIFRPDILGVRLQRIASALPAIYTLNFLSDAELGDVIIYKSVSGHGKSCFREQCLKTRAWF